MSIFDIRKDFAYQIDINSSSINYVRYYNFSSTTTTTIPLTLYNSGSQQIPITVNMTTSEPWIQITDSANGSDLKFPNGNVVLSPNQTKIVSVVVDLPPEIEILPSSSINSFVNIQLKSGSFPIVPSTTGGNNGLKNIIVTTADLATIIQGQSQVIEATVYDNDGNIIQSPNIEWMSEDDVIARVQPTNTLIDTSTSVTITGINVGETKITAKCDDIKRVISVRVVPIPPGTNTSTNTNKPSQLPTE